MNTGEEPLERVLAQLDRWRHLPKYRLEPHVDVLFGMTLPRVIQSKFNTKGELHVIPEFPIKTGDGERTFNVDFAVLTHGGANVFLVELKTDSNSIDAEQLCKMRGKGLRPFHRLVDDIRDVAKASPQKAKYLHLVFELNRAGVIDVPSQIKKLDQAAAVEGCSARKTASGQPQLVLLCPSHRDIRADTECLDSFSCIDFAEYADIITPSLEETFARYLREWQSEAGKQKPDWP